MAIQKIFAYNTGSLISGTTQVGDIAVSEADVEYSANYGGLQWWGGPDESLGFVIAIPVSGNTQPTPISGITASLGFYGTKNMTNPLDESTFVDLVNGVFNQNFVNGSDAKTWLNNNGYWTSYGVSLCDSFTFSGNNATTTTNSAINDGTSGWDSSAYSLETFTGPVSVTFQTSANGNILMGGFSYNPTVNLGDTYVDTSYGIYLYNSDQIEIYENGGQAAVINVGTVVSSSDVWKVDYDGTSVKYYRNSTLLYTSTNAVTQPLHVFFPLFTPNEGAVNICAIGTLSPTPTTTPTPTGTPVAATPTNTPTLTQTPTSTDLTNITTYTISGCTSLNEFVANLGPGALAPGDIFYFEFTGGTPSGCYRIVNKINAVPTDGTTPLYFYTSCALCVAAREVTPTPTVTQTPTTTPTPSVTNTQTPTVTNTQTPTNTLTPTPTNPSLLQILNETTGSRTVTSFTLDGTPQSLSSGSYPITAGNNGYALTHGASSTPNGVIFNFGGSGTFDLYSYLNGSLVNYLSSYNNNSYTMGGVFLQTSDQVLLRITDSGALPTPTQTATQTTTPTPTVTKTQTPTPSVTPTNTQTPSVTPTQGGTGNFNVTISQVGLDVVWSGSGFFNLAALSSTGPGSVSSGFNAGQAIWAIGVSAATDTYSGTSLTYPTSFGTGGVAVTSSSGSTVGILPGPPGVPRALYVPSGYVSNTTISGSATYANNTIAGMGLSAGTYTWNFTTGGNSTALVMNIVA